jgi:hypothetical protein
VRAALVVAEFAVARAVLVGAGLTGRGRLGLQHVALGVTAAPAAGVAVARLAPSAARHPEPAPVLALGDEDWQNGWWRPMHLVVRGGGDAPGDPLALARALPTRRWHAGRSDRRRGRHRSRARGPRRNLGVSWSRPLPRPACACLAFGSA